MGLKSNGSGMEYLPISLWKVGLLPPLKTSKQLHHNTFVAIYQVGCPHLLASKGRFYSPSGWIWAGQMLSLDTKLHTKHL